MVGLTFGPERLQQMLVVWVDYGFVVSDGMEEVSLCCEDEHDLVVESLS